MANKIFTFGPIEVPGSQKKLPVLEKWKDVSMLSKSAVDNNSIEKSFSLKVSKSVNVQAVKNSIRNIFTWIPGERILLPEFGSKLYSLLYEGITPLTEEQIIAEIRQCVSEWEPRVRVTEVVDVSTIEDHEDNTIHLEIRYIIPELSDEEYSYSFYYNRGE